MKRIVHLSDLDEVPVILDGVFAKYEFTSKEVEDARKKLAGRGLRFDNFTGHTHDNTDGTIEQFRRYMSGTTEQMENPTKWVPYVELESVMKWEFKRMILGEANRAKFVAANS